MQFLEFNIVFMMVIFLISIFIFPLIKLCEQQGTEDVEEEEIREAYDRVVASQRLRLSR